MNRRGSRPTMPLNYHKYLKPGALARIRDSKISARSHRLNSLSQISINRLPSSPPLPSSPAQPHPNAADGCPYFVARIYGPRCPQRKKLVAAKSVFYVALNSSVDLPDPVIDSFGSDIIAAN